MTSTDQKDLPQLATPSDAVVHSIEWLFEPAWRGERVMARLRGGRVTVTDERGAPVADELAAEAAEVLEPALDAEEALIDGVWTNMPFVGAGSAAQHLAEAIAEEGLTEELPDPIENESRRAFVAIDLVELDGQTLHDVPLMERRRLLTSVVEENVRVRVSPAVRVPIHNWLIQWRAAGFDRYVAKHVNSRYTPGSMSDEWLLLSTAARGGPNPVTRLFWPSRGKKVLHIEDDGNPRLDPQANPDQEEP
jgi:bifunctional non-homologous end joining protein LigD